MSSDQDREDAPAEPVEEVPEAAAAEAAVDEPDAAEPEAVTTDDEVAFPPLAATKDWRSGTSLTLSIVKLLPSDAPGSMVGFMAKNKRE